MVLFFNHADSTVGGGFMYDILIKVIVAAALLELGLTFNHSGDCRSSARLDQIQRASKKVLHVDWTPISIFPEEGKRFRSQAK